ncbi:MAG: zinc ribbon domain-containing protein [Negativicutes bacterium]|nr:zinc ribbon domain-containing protein [Negativicutes bacterium]
MHCSDCGKEKGDHANACPHCGYAPNITVLSPEEREQFQGVTIEQNERQEERRANGYYEYTSTGPNHRVHVRHISFDSTGGGFWSRILIILAVLGFIAALLFVALPLALIVIAVAALASLVIKLIFR